ncbi:MAG TPA: GNAT family N-acetyltransferase [Candidatus Acidoferrales bacterium]|nr:GNAT family N-acetyltransferase [Candidatus Acidoferrales bacterium]
MTEDAGGVLVRQARLEDAAALADLATQLGNPSTPGEVVARLRRILPHPDHAVFVAETEGSGAAGRAQGFAHVFAGMALETGARAELLGLVTEQALRSRGIGRRLVAAAEEWALARGFATLLVRCNVVRTRAHSFYEGMGYQCVKTQKNFRKSLAGGGESVRT